MTKTQQNQNDTVLPFGWSVVIALATTALVFCFFGGGHYLANHSEIDYRHFHNPDDENDPLTWLSWLLETGFLPALGIFLACSIALVILKRRMPKK